MSPRRNETTIQAALTAAMKRLADTSPTPRLDAEILIAHTLKRDRCFLHAWPEQRLDSTQTLGIRSLVEQRSGGAPIAYLTGEKEFWSRTFIVNRSVLIPRPETEELVEAALQTIPTRMSWRIADLGTGSGAIAITLAAERPLCNVVACDVSYQALATAKANAIRHNTGNTAFFAGNWLDAAPKMAFDLIVSNPPYIEAEDPHLERGDIRAEPHLALIGGNDGLTALRTIIAQARHCLRPSGHLLLEHGYNQSSAVHALLYRSGYHNIAVRRDLQGHPRITSAQRPATD